MGFLYQNEANRLTAILKKSIFKTRLKPASKEDQDYLKAVDYPPEIINFYEYAEPSSNIDHNGISLYTIKELKEENEEAIPSYVIFPFGFRCIASTMYGDVYCVDINKKEGHIPGSIVLVSHDEIDEDIDEEDIEFGIIKVADNFKSFLNLYLTGKIANSYHALKNG